MSKKKNVSIEREMGLEPRGKIKIVAERVFANGEPCYKIFNVEAATEDSLPSLYTNGYPCCYYEETYDFDNYRNIKILHVRWKDGSKVVTHDLKVGSVYRADEFDTIVTHVKDAGTHLAAIIVNWKKMCFKDGESVWKGTRVEII